MKRLTPLILLTGLTGCSGVGVFFDHAFSLPGTNPNIPMADSENVRRALGMQPDIEPLQTESGNIWPKFDVREPTLSDVANNPQREDRRGFPPTVTPGQGSGLPDHRQPRPRGSAPPTLDAPVQPIPNQTPRLPPRVPPTANAPRRPGGVIQTPGGPGIDAGGTNGYRQLTAPTAPGAIIVPNGNGTSTVIKPNGSIETIPTPR